MAISTKLIFIILISVILRLGFIVYLSKFQSITKQQLSGTDIDYKVYTDAAYLQSPYLRHTYRYTPLLAYLMRYNHIIQYAGKIFFVLFDLLAMLALSKISRNQYIIAIVSLYGLNPLFIYLTVRGSCQSISLALMFWTFWFIFKNNGNIVFENSLNAKKNISDNRKIVWFGYILYGLWVHFRVYPIIFLPMILIHQYKLAKRIGTKPLHKILSVLLFAAGTFIGLLVLFYSIYGQSFIQQTYLYHTKRLDNRHSFSPIFYQIYLSMNSQSFVRSMAQLVVIVAITKRLHKNISPYYAHFLITYAFVSFNKVITMQYYMWIFGALLILLPESSLMTNSNRRYQKSFGYLMQYCLGILLWVWSSIKLQKDGQNVFNMMWFICIFKLFFDIWAVTGFMSTIKNKQSYQSIPQQDKDQIIITGNKTKLKN